jgi:hypothetical protein
MPVEHIEPCWEYINSCEDYINKDDIMISKYFYKNNIKSITTIPTIIQHIGDTELSSLIDDYTVFNCRVSPTYIQDPKDSLSTCIKIQDYYADMVKLSMEEIRERARRTRELAGGTITGMNINGEFIIQK